VAPKGHVFAKAHEMDFHELRAETFLLRETGSGTRTVMEAMFKQHLFKPSRILMLGSNETVKQGIMAGMGISLLSLHSLELELRTHEVCLLKVMGTPVLRNWHIVHMSRKNLAPAAAAFHSYLQEQTQPYLKKTFARYKLK
jgi:DNA-binding transcriptional LysR family regulator